MLLPYGPARYVPIEERPQFSEFDPTNDSLSSKYGKLIKIFPRNDSPTLQGSETIIFDQEGQMYGMNKHSELIHFTNLLPKKKSFIETNKNGNTWLADVNVVANLGLGRPLGGKFCIHNNKEGNRKMLYFADSVMGLGRIDLEKNHPKVEIVATHVFHKGKNIPLHFVDDVDIGGKTGHIYFSSATQIQNVWHTSMYNSKIDFLRGKRTGKLVRYKPETDEVDVLVDNLWFANGVAIDREEKFVLAVETFSGRVLKYHLIGPKKGETEVIVPTLAGYPDGVDCDFSPGGLCYVTIVYRQSFLLDLIYSLPSLAETFVRTILMMVPPWSMPEAIKYGGVLEFDPNDGNEGSMRLLQDPTGDDIHTINGVTVHSGKLYFGSLANNFIGVYNLDKSGGE